MVHARSTGEPFEEAAGRGSRDAGDEITERELNGRETFIFMEIHSTAVPSELNMKPRVNISPGTVTDSLPEFPLSPG